MIPRAPNKPFIEALSRNQRNKDSTTHQLQPQGHTPHHRLTAFFTTVNSHLSAPHTHGPILTPLQSHASSFLDTLKSALPPKRPSTRSNSLYTLHDFNPQGQERIINFEAVDGGREYGFRELHFDLHPSSKMFDEAEISHDIIDGFESIGISENGKSLSTVEADQFQKREAILHHLQSHAFAVITEIEAALTVLHGHDTHGALDEYDLVIEGRAICGLVEKMMGDLEDELGPSSEGLENSREAMNSMESLVTVIHSPERS